MSSPTGSTGGHLSPEGRGVGKPIRRRTRASRRTPTTLVQTDAKNFRAMVQQFTSAPTATGPHPAESNLGFGFGERQAHANVSPGNSMMVTPDAVFNLQYHQQKQQMLPEFEHQDQAYMFSFDNNDAGAGSFSFKDMGKP